MRRLTRSQNASALRGEGVVRVNMMADIVTLDRADKIAADALRHWGGNASVPQRVRMRDNIIYRVARRDGTLSALRIHRDDRYSSQAVRSEIAFLMLLERAGFLCPRPLRTVDNRLMVTEGGCAVTMLAWIFGKRAAEMTEDLNGPFEDRQRLFFDIGNVIAHFHNTVDAMELPLGFERPSWDAEALLGNNPHWGRFWENPNLTTDERSILIEARNKARGDLEHYISIGDDFGLIHGDIQLENVIVYQRRMGLIDMSDFGPGFRLYDLCSVLVDRIDSPYLEQETSALIEGYRSRRELPDHALDYIPMMIMLRTMALAGWVMDRFHSEEPEMRDYAARAAKTAKDWLEQG